MILGNISTLLGRTLVYCIGISYNLKVGANYAVFLLEIINKGFISVFINYILYRIVSCNYIMFSVVYKSSSLKSLVGRKALEKKVKKNHFISVFKILVKSQSDGQKPKIKRIAYLEP